MNAQETPAAESPSPGEAAETLNGIGLVWAQTGSGVIGKGGTMLGTFPKICSTSAG
ncbi:hypothetical protein AHiyo1_02400 [Arthrobacter sp. Hiyo1]|nr:hypothetical protein AHiyo1_02400 [Arthrobacter sp. Hiyo1]